jgi:hypothetical protein
MPETDALKQSKEQQKLPSISIAIQLRPKRMAASTKEPDPEVRVIVESPNLLNDVITQ